MVIKDALFAAAENLVDRQVRMKGDGHICEVASINWLFDKIHVMLVDKKRQKAVIWLRALDEIATLNDTMNSSIWGYTINCLNQIYPTPLEHHVGQIKIRKDGTYIRILSAQFNLEMDVVFTVCDVLPVCHPTGQVIFQPLAIRTMTSKEMISQVDCSLSAEGDLLDG